MSLILVTGGAGFIGSHLVSALVDRGDQVRVLDDLSTGREANLPDRGVDLVVGDVRDRELMRKTCEGADWVYHLAAMISVPESMSDPLTCYDVNVNGTLNVLWSAYQAGVKRLILSSSCAIYGDASHAVREGDPPKPLSPYAGSKLAAESGASAFTQAYDFPTVSLRYFNVYGPKQSPDSPYAAAIPLFIEALLAGKPPTIYGDGGQTRDFIFVEDVVRANLLAAESEGARGGVFNIAGFGPVSIRQLVDTLRDLIPGSPEPIFAPPRPGDILHSRADLGNANRALGYRPEITLEQGLQRTVQWFQSEKDIERV